MGFALCADYHRDWRADFIYGRRSEPAGKGAVRPVKSTRHGCDRSFALGLRGAVNIFLRKGKRAGPLHARDRYRYFDGELAAETRPNVSSGSTSKECRRADDHHHCLVRCRGGLRQYSTLSPGSNRNSPCDAGKVGNAAAALTFI